MFDVCIIGGGIVGLATAFALQNSRPGLAVAVLEQEADIARHQSGRNSGVIHSGIYYPPTSLKARLCRQGADDTKAFCSAEGIPVETCGKYLVASTASEMPRLRALAARAAENGIPCTEIDASTLKKREPAIEGLGALHLSGTGIVDYRAVCRALARWITDSGGTIIFNARVTALHETADGMRLRTGAAEHAAKFLVACAGLQADRIAAMAGLAKDFRIVPFRGEYFRLPESRNALIHALIYPIPDPALPFLGIHLTRMIDGGITVGPSAILSLSRENYEKFSTNAKDMIDMAGFAGFWRAMAANLRPGLAELRIGVSRSVYLDACRKYCPSLTLEDLQPAPAGIRAQAGLKDGTLAHDFLIRRTRRSLHVCNAPSPAATSALPIGRMIADDVLRNDCFSAE